MTAVVDTSAFMRLFLPDGAIPEGLDVFMRGVERGENLAIAPELMLAEAANVAVKKQRQGALSPVEAAELVRLMRGMPIRYISHGDLVVPAASAAADFGLTVYDSLFLVLARQKAASLFTADDRLAKIADRFGLTV